MNLVAHRYDEAELEEKSLKHTSRSRVARTIIPELRWLDLPPEVESRAEIVFHKLDDRVRRGKKRRMMLFYCVSQAYNELAVHMDKFKLGKLFDLSSGDVKRCDTEFSPLNTGYEPCEVSVSAMDFVKEFCHALSLDDSQFEMIRQIYDRVARRCPALMQEHPQTLAAGFLKYHLKINGITLTTSLSKVANRSMATIENTEKRIEEIDND